MLFFVISSSNTFLGKKRKTTKELFTQLILFLLHDARVFTECVYVRSMIHTWKKPGDPITNRNSLFGAAMDITLFKRLKDAGIF